MSRTATIRTLRNAYRLEDEHGTALQSFPWRTLAERDHALGQAKRLAHALGFNEISRITKKGATFHR